MIASPRIRVNSVSPGILLTVGLISLSRYSSLCSVSTGVGFAISTRAYRRFSGQDAVEDNRHSKCVSQSSFSWSINHVICYDVSRLALYANLIQRTLRSKCYVLPRVERLLDPTLFLMLAGLCKSYIMLFQEDSKTTPLYTKVVNSDLPLLSKESLCPFFPSSISTSFLHTSAVDQYQDSRDRMKEETMTWLKRRKSAASTLTQLWQTHNELIS